MSVNEIPPHRRATNGPGADLNVKRLLRFSDAHDAATGRGAEPTRRSWTMRPGRVPRASWHRRAREADFVKNWCAYRLCGHAAW